MNRPAWASGPEWEGWEVLPGTNPRNVGRALNVSSRLEWMRIISYAKDHFSLDSYRSDIDFDLPLDSPESALRIVNAIAGEFGGWA